MSSIGSTTTSVPDDYQVGEGGHGVGFYFLWIGLFLFLMFWALGALRSCAWRQEMPVGISSGAATDEQGRELSKKERKQRLVAYFESGKNKVVRAINWVVGGTASHPNKVRSFLTFLRSSRQVLNSENFTNVVEGDKKESSGVDENNKGHSDNDGDDDCDIESNEAQRICITLPGGDGGSGEDMNNTRVCSKHCAICLEPYKAGDSVLWSSSPDCSHVFHQDCLVDGLTRVKKNETPCPCCRATFCNYNTIMEEKQAA